MWSTASAVGVVRTDYTVAEAEVVAVAAGVAAVAAEVAAVVAVAADTLVPEVVADISVSAVGTSAAAAVAVADNNPAVVVHFHCKRL